MSVRVFIHEGSVPVLKPHVKLRYNEARGRWFVLAPERLLVPDETAVEILRLMDGRVSVGGIAEVLSRRYKAELATIRRDVCSMLQGLADKGFLSDSAAAVSCDEGRVETGGG